MAGSSKVKAKKQDHQKKKKRNGPSGLTEERKERPIGYIAEIHGSS